MTFDYDVIVIGGGAAGLTSAALAVTLGASALLVESERLGGDCTWYGCIPSKTLLKAAKVVYESRVASRYGLRDVQPAFSFAELMDHVRRVRQRVYHDADHPDIYEGRGIDVRTGYASFVDEHTIKIDGDETHRFSGRFLIVATGAKTVVPPIDGIDAIPYLTNESLFEMSDQPSRLAIVGAGPVGVEMAQAFNRLGTMVTVVDSTDRILYRGHPETTSLLRRLLEQEGIVFKLNTQVRGMERDADSTILSLDEGRESTSVAVDAVLMATGRRADASGLNLAAAGIEHNENGITVDARCRTNRKHVYAVGDVTGRYEFTHMSEHMSKVAVTNALLKIPRKVDRRHVPWVIFTDPEVAHVGWSEQELTDSGKVFQTYRFPYEKVDRAVTDGATEGLIIVRATHSRGRILGADIVGTSAGELICEYALAMKNRIPLRKISDTIHPYPTYGLGARRAADQWYVQRHSPMLVRLLKALFGYRGPVLRFGKEDIL